MHGAATVRVFRRTLTFMKEERPLRLIVKRATPTGVSAGVDFVEGARVTVSSEQSLFPIDNVFDQQRGPGGSCWVAGQAGEQTVMIVLDAPTALRQIVVESEQHGGLARQAIDLAVGTGAGTEVTELGTRAFTFKPYGPSFQTERWALGPELVTRLRLRITPDGPEARACLTSVVAYA
jgi:hypothetical protein